LDILSLSIFPIEIFPQGGLTSSVITTAWIGIFVVCFFNLRFGWVLSGLIVPGYLIPLLLVNPWSAAVTIAEGIITYLIVYWGSEKIPSKWYWSSLFGRDRFFALVITSVLVRVGFDVFLLPWLGNFLNENYALNFDYQNNLHSFGLIIVSLIANQFWKTGLSKGLLPFFVTITTTYLLVRYGLMELTNFTLSNLSYIYEDIASSILASPKAYIILLSAAFIASRMNLRYGWDFNGILIPALLALQWYEPLKILTSFIEALVILGFASLILKTPVFANVNVEGARKLLLFFNIGFLYKILLGHFLLWQYPEFKITDSYGFGYLLATLIAIKMHDKDIAIRYTTGTIHTSLVAVFVASIIGFVFSQTNFVTIPSSKQLLHNIELKTTQPVINSNTLYEQIRLDKVNLYQNRIEKRFIMPSVYELELFNQAIKQLKRYKTGLEQQELSSAISSLQSIGFKVDIIENRYLYLREVVATRGWGIYLINLNTRSHLLVEVPYPMDEKGTLESGVALFKEMQANALAIAGASRLINIDGSSNVLNNRQTIFHEFYQALLDRNTIQIRAKQQLDLISDSQNKPANTKENPKNYLLVKRRLPPDLDVNKLKILIGPYKIFWQNELESNLPFNEAFDGIAELNLYPDAVRQLIASEFQANDSLSVLKEDKRIDGYLQEWLLNQEDVIARSGTDLYQIPRIEELLFFDEEVLTPILKVIDVYNRDHAFDQNTRKNLNMIMANATAFNYSLIQYQHKKSGSQFLILQENDNNQKKRYWGTYVFRLGAEARPIMIEIPRPVYEVNSFEYAVSLYEQLKAKYLLISGVHPRTNIDGSSDLVRFKNLSSLFTLVNQVVMRESRQKAILALSVRAYGHRDDVPPPEQDILLSFSHTQNQQYQQEIDSLFELFNQQGVTYKEVSGELNTAGYELGGLSQSLYARMADNRIFGILWLSPYLRQVYAQKDSDWQENSQFKALGIDTQQWDLSLLIEEEIRKITKPNNVVAIPGKLQNSIIKYLSSGDIIVLLKILKQWPDYQFIRVVDRDSKQSFLILYAQARLISVVNLTPRNIDSAINVSHFDNIGKKVEKFIHSRIAFLNFAMGVE